MEIYTSGVWINIGGGRIRNSNLVDDFEMDLRYFYFYFYCATDCERFHFVIITNIITYISYYNRIELESDSSADHSANTGATRPSTTDLAFRPNVSVWTADSDATTAAVTIVVGIEGAGETSGGSARVRVGKLESLHRSRERKGVKELL